MTIFFRMTKACFVYVLWTLQQETRVILFKFFIRAAFTWYTSIYRYINAYIYIQYLWVFEPLQVYCPLLHYVKYKYFIPTHLLLFFIYYIHCSCTNWNAMHHSRGYDTFFCSKSSICCMFTQRSRRVMSHVVLP